MLRTVRWMLLVLVCLETINIQAAYAEDSAKSDEERNIFLLSYFHRVDSIYLAWSKDGLHFTKIHKRDPVLISKVGEGFTRDPFLSRGQDGWFHVVATDAHFNDRTPNACNDLLFYARSRDLYHWEDQASIPVSTTDPQFVKGGTANWAPEITWDPTRDQYLLHWSAHPRKRNTHQEYKTGIIGVYFNTFEDLYQPTEFNGGDPAAHIAQNKFILFDPAQYDNVQSGRVIDSNMIYVDGKFVLFVKDLGVGHRAYVSERSNGGFEPMGELIGTNQEEGGFAIQLHGQKKWRFITDIFRDPKRTFAVYESDDLQSWATIPEDTLGFPKRACHGSILMISEDELEAILKARK